MLKINIEQLTFDCIIGILDRERKLPQEVIVDISFEYYFDTDGSDYIDYVKIVNIVEETMKKEKFGLLEDAIIYIRSLLKNQFEISNLRVKITKPNILNNCIVSVEE